MKSSTRMLTLFALSVALPLLACRYSVRDTGFVDLGEAAYALVLAGNDEAGRGALYRRAASATFQDANISFSAAGQDREERPHLFLQDAGGRKLELSLGDGLPRTAEDATVLLESIASSPLRADIQDAALQSFAVVVLVEGARSADNAQARATIEAAIRKVAKLMPSMPKPVNKPPVLLRVPVENQRNETIALWGLGFDPALSEEPRAAVVFGRGRRIGSPLEGPLITGTAVQERLSIIGQDCECELDRAWMKGPLLPARWDGTLQRRAARTLGFDPENPLVRTEISRIVHRGPGAGKIKKLATSSTSLGYAENVLEDSSSTDVAENPTAGAEPAQGSTNTARPAPDIAANEPGVPSGSIPWWMVLAGGAGLLGLAGWWWIKVGREQG